MAVPLHNSAVTNILSEMGRGPAVKSTPIFSSVEFGRPRDILRVLVWAIRFARLQQSLARAASTTSRELRREGGTERYHASYVDQAAWDRAHRTNTCKLALHTTLAPDVVESYGSDSHRSRSPVA